MEVIYQRALAIELQFQGLSFEREKEMTIFYREMHIGTHRVDFFVENAVMVELKAIEKLEDVHKAQAINYCEAYNIADGLLINFGAKSLEFKRVYNKRLVTPNHGNPVIPNSYTMLLKKWGFQITNTGFTLQLQIMTVPAKSWKKISYVNWQLYSLNG